MQSDQGLRCALTELLDTIELMKSTSGLNFAHAPDESESVHFAHARRHIFAWRGPYMMYCTELLGRKFSRRHFDFFISIFSRKLALETICIKCQCLFASCEKCLFAPCEK